MALYVHGSDRSQVTLSPECPDALIAQEHTVRVADAFIGELDMVAMGYEGAMPALTGRPSYHPFSAAPALRAQSAADDGRQANDYTQGVGIKTEELFWKLAVELRDDYPQLVEGTIMNRPCLRFGTEFLALVDHKGSGLVVKLPKARVAELIASDKGQSFAPAKKVFREWLSVPTPDRQLWRDLLLEGIAFVGK